MAFNPEWLMLVDFTCFPNVFSNRANRMEQVEHGGILEHQKLLPEPSFGSESSAVGVAVFSVVARGGGMREDDPPP